MKQRVGNIIQGQDTEVRKQESQKEGGNRKARTYV